MKILGEIKESPIIKDAKHFLGLFNKYLIKASCLGFLAILNTAHYGIHFFSILIM